MAAAGAVLPDLTDLANFEQGFPHEVFAVHRRACPVFWHEPTGHTPDGEGFWSVATHAETHRVLRDPVTYSSETGGDRPYGGTLLEDLPIAGQVLNMMDDPRHSRIRRLVSAGLTPRMIRRVEDELRRRTVVLLDAVDDGAAFDFLTTVAAELPMQMICLLLGVPESERHWLFEAVEPSFDRKDPAGGSTADPSTLQVRLVEFAAAVIAAKREAPADDMLSIVATARLDDADPAQLTEGELLTFFYLLFAAGSETTRNAIAGGLAALVERPDQLAALRDDPGLLRTAIEEIIRWTTPSSSKRRTVTAPTELGGCRLAPGDKVLVWEASANRDEAVFADPMRFDVRRDPNPHLGFGFGAHYCLGASLARLEIRVLLEELLPRFTDLRLVAPVEWTRSNRHTGVRHLVVELRR